MSNSIQIHSPQIADDGDAVAFTIIVDGAQGRGEVTRSALDELAQGQIGGLIEVFDRHRERIQALALQNWVDEHTVVRVASYHV